jgi:hypothetical protein
MVATDSLRKVVTAFYYNNYNKIFNKLIKIIHILINLFNFKSILPLINIEFIEIIIKNIFIFIFPIVIIKLGNL